MLNIKRTKKKFVRKLTPYLLKELFRFLNIYSKVTGKGIGKESIESFHILSKSVVELFHHTYKYGSIWTTLFVPSEIIFAMKLYPFSLEVAAALCSKFGQSSHSLAEADLSAIPTDVCSFHRTALGNAYMGVYPRPLFLAGTTTICDSNLKTIQICKSITGKESIILDVPYEMNDNSIKYLTNQLISLAKCMEEVTGKKMEKHALAEAIDLSNQAREKMIELNHVRQDPLSPLAGHDALGFMVPSHYLAGSQYSVDFYTAMVDELSGVIATRRKNGEVADEKEIRLLWLELKPYFKADVFDKIKNAGKTKIVFEEINHVYWDKLDPDKPYESLARKLISNHNNGPLEKRLEVIKMLAKDYNVDGIIAFSTWGCRRNNAAIPTIKKELNREGYPLLNLDGDCVDDGNYMSGQVATRTEGFVEMLGAKK
ncbi:MAG: 2-hydroxyacyl-CoA dehydratase [Candidatus Scalindua sediminis]|nr:2-hydroxyacyl-CoA dehydratase [Candidatus Scalindua sediminis]